ncbi:MAG: hypothetical protein HY390_00515 [Deltaproteobacteria bacterium]|nr:hypothetical protein [Deltaproteobacteria bacterium]
MTIYLQKLNGGSRDPFKEEHQLHLLQPTKIAWQLPAFRKLKNTSLEELLEEAQYRQSFYFKMALALHHEDVETYILSQKDKLSDDVKASLEFRKRLRTNEEFELIQVLKAFSTPIRSFLFHPTKRLLAALSFDQKVYFWNLTDLAHIKEIETPFTEKIDSLTFAPNAPILVSIAPGQTLCFWDISDLKNILPLITPFQCPNQIISSSWSSDGNLLAIRDQQQSIYLWDLSQKTSPQRIFLLNSDSNKNEPLFWENTNAKTVEQLKLPFQRNEIQMFALSPNGELLVSADAQGSLRLWLKSKAPDLHTLGFNPTTFLIPSSEDEDAHHSDQNGEVIANPMTHWHERLMFHQQKSPKDAKMNVLLEMLSRATDDQRGETQSYLRNCGPELFYPGDKDQTVLFQQLLLDIFGTQTLASLQQKLAFLQKPSTEIAIAELLQTIFYLYPRDHAFMYRFETLLKVVFEWPWAKDRRTVLTKTASLIRTINEELAPHVGYHVRAKPLSTQKVSGTSNAVQVISWELIQITTQYNAQKNELETQEVSILTLDPVTLIVSSEEAPAVYGTLEPLYFKDVETAKRFLRELPTKTPTSIGRGPEPLIPLSNWKKIKPVKGGIALLADPDLVDYHKQDSGAEASNIEASLERFQLASHTPIEVISKLTTTDLHRILEQRTIFIIPEFSGNIFIFTAAEKGKELIRKFVSQGGTLILFGDNSHTAVNTLFFEWEIRKGSSDDKSYLATNDVIPLPQNSNNVASLSLKDAPTSLLSYDATFLFDQNTFPPEALSLYYDVNSGHSVAVYIPMGVGHIYILGWDWFNANPIGSQGVIGHHWHALLEAIIEKHLAGY